MRRHLARFIDELTPNARLLLAIGVATPFFVIDLIAHGHALASPAIRSGLNVGAMWVLQAVLGLAAAINVAVACCLWPRRRSRDKAPAPALVWLVCLAVGLGFTALCVMAGTFTTGANLVLAGVLVVGLMLFELRPVLVSYLVSVGVMLGHDVAVSLGWLPYAPALSPQAFAGGQAPTWFVHWRLFVFYASWVVLLGLLLFLFARLDHLHDKLVRLSCTDALTGLANRRRFMAALEAELTRQARSGGELCLMLIDADHFKDINDQHGHPTGDAVLRQIALILMRSVRAPADVPARLGGEEFAVILPEARLDEARRVAERLREQVAAHVFEDGAVRLHASVSIGLVAARGLTLQALLQQADAALYLAKRRGRNRVAETVTWDAEVSA